MQYESTFNAIDKAEILRQQAQLKYTEAQIDFANFVLEHYVRNDFKELSSENLPVLIEMKYHAPKDALKSLEMTPEQVREFYLMLQQMLYSNQNNPL